MKLFKVEGDVFEDFIVNEVVTALQEGVVVCLPFDTSYGFCCDPNNKEALKTLLSIKGDRPGKEYSVYVSDFAMLEDLIAVEGKVKDFVFSYMPGKVTLVTRCKKKLESLNGDFVGVRMLKDVFLTEIAKRFGSALITTSANKTGEPTCYDIGTLFGQVGSDAALGVVVDNGTLIEGDISTVVRIDEGEGEILRQGSVEVTL